MSLIGLDIGTTGCKAIIFDMEGNILGQGSREYPVLFPRPLWAEQDAELVFRLAMQALNEAIGNAQVKVTTMAISCQGEAFIPVDKDGKPLRHAILGMDTRTGEENRWLKKTFGEDDLFKRTGMPVHTVNTLPKLLWLRKNEPEIWRSCDRFLLYEDFFIRRFSGKAIISHCLASRTQMYDLEGGHWAEDILDTCGIDSKRLAQLAPEDGCCGTVSEDFAGSSALPAGLRLIAGGHDQACAALGSGVMEPGMAMVSTGTAEVIEVAMDKPALHPSLQKGNVSVYRHVVPDLYLAMTLNHCGGISLRWFRDNFAEQEMAMATERNTDAYDILLQNSSAVPSGILVMPHFSGSGTPQPDSRSKGALIGLTLATGKADIAKAILEGLCFELRKNIELLRNAGIRIADVRAVGGGAKSSLWLQMKSDICNINLRVPSSTESACRGAAMLAGIGSGGLENLKAATKQWIDFPNSYSPDKDRKTEYDHYFNLYKKLYPMLKDINHSL